MADDPRLVVRLMHGWEIPEALDVDVRVFDLIVHPSVWADLDAVFQDWYQWGVHGLFGLRVRDVMFEDGFRPAERRWTLDIPSRFEELQVHIYLLERMVDRWLDANGFSAEMLLGSEGAEPWPVETELAKLEELSGKWAIPGSLVGPAVAIRIAELRER